ncbi:Putative amidase C550.07 [Taphrina deformans PYCC 5710]|uniref:Amidase C550.07 n=1 Tax=Taphrina deformans (strain PYCC 5710 / ATCC 11124 / CBS 356.35 / IMI 108563 / JCM 9778 / NBRC 8474) TaxID=1097556 RepID=R4X6Z9_TAPDE|nr:Putative amidase C550.07 [Taphrina deformans PYCC 5710]|eukprot:CCG80781.1 Putative amidase C550.07 [Taphrina deformans PYCC 5710]
MSSTLADRIRPALVRIHDAISKDTLSVVDYAVRCDLLTAREVEITECDASELLSNLARGTLSSEECTRAFVRRAGIATQLVNCCTEIMATEAIDRAKFMDQYLAKTGKTFGPLHGLPMSFKEHILMKGKIVHCSYVAWINNIEPKNGLIYDVLLECGVVPICRTPQPQCVMYASDYALVDSCANLDRHLETASNIYGHTLNPYNRELTPGGSSGGESALITMRGSPMGVGSDIGGSIRGPAGACGLYGFKTSAYRLPTGTKGLHKGRETIVGCAGPLAHSRTDLELWMKAVLSREPWLREPSILPIPWRSVEKKQNLRIAVMWSDGIVKPLPPVARALTQVAAILRNSGMSVVDWQPKDHDESWDIISSLYYTNAAEDEHEMFALGGEPMLPLTEYLLSQPGVRMYNAKENDALLLQRNAYRTKYAQHWLDQEEQAGGKIDVILCPVSPGPAPKLGTSKYWSYTSVWNLLDYPGAVFPVTTTLEMDVKPEYAPRNASEQEIWDDYNPQEWLGLPIGLQLVARRYQEEQLFSDWETIEQAIAASGAPS